MAEREYVLGTGDVEIRRLGIQHTAWRDLAHAAWQRAGVKAGDTVVDIGCGPGYATLDLARLVGPRGKVIAIDRSRRFLDHLQAQANAEGFSNIETLERDLVEDALPQDVADHVWSRWVFIFVKDPRALLGKARRMLGAGGSLVLHEYMDYASWRSEPRSPQIEAFVAAVMASWRAEGGDPDIAPRLAQWLRQDGMRVDTTPIPRQLKPGQPGWEWLRSYLESGPVRLVELGQLADVAPAQIMREVAKLEAHPGASMAAPTVMEIIARASPAALHR